jgi:two-component system sensor histidine kinase MtrB
MRGLLSRRNAQRLARSAAQGEIRPAPDPAPAEVAAATATASGAGSADSARSANAGTASDIGSANGAGSGNGASSARGTGPVIAAGPAAGLARSTAVREDSASGPAGRAPLLAGLRGYLTRALRVTAARLRPAVSSGAASVASAVSHAHARWRGSLQVRVVTATLVISAVVTAVLGFFLTQQVADGLLQSKVKESASQTWLGKLNAEGQLGDRLSQPGSDTCAKQLISVVNSLQPPTINPDYRVTIKVNPTPGFPPLYCAAATSNLAMEQQIPQSLISAVKADLSNANQLPYVSRTLRFDGTGPPLNGTGPQRGVLFGAPLGVHFQLFYFFPLSAEQNTLKLVQGTVLLTGIALVFLLAGIAWLVTRWVVQPVARASQGARRLSTGKLDERMPVRGTDELAALATSFNEMAGSLQDKMQELQNLSQVQRQFVSDVSHELRTPLTTIRIAADLLYESRQQLDGSGRRSAELLQSQLERFESLLVDLLEISRFDANAATLDAEPVDICDLARNAADVAQQLAERRGAKIEFRLPSEPCVAEADRRRVERILRNLLVNAVEHGENKDAVVTVAADRDAVAVSVRDYGVGLAPGEDRLVFDRFWRADPARARTTGGTGLGLSIALEDALLHGGWLEAWGAPGQGSVFRLTLPRRAGCQLAGSPLGLGPVEAVLAVTLTGQPHAGPAPDHPGALPGSPSDPVSRGSENGRFRG